MKYVVGFVSALCLVVGAIAMAQPLSSWSLADIDQRLAQHAQRACIYPIGGWTKVDCSNAAAAQSAQLNAWSRYIIQCGDDSYIATGDQSTDEADANDGWLPVGAWLELMTTDTVRYVSCLNKTSDSDCRYWECK